MEHQSRFLLHCTANLLRSDERCWGWTSLDVWIANLLFLLLAYLFPLQQTCITVHLLTVRSSHCSDSNHMYLFWHRSKSLNLMVWSKNIRGTSCWFRQTDSCPLTLKWHWRSGYCCKEEVKSKPCGGGGGGGVDLTEVMLVRSDLYSCKLYYKLVLHYTSLKNATKTKGKHEWPMWSVSGTLRDYTHKEPGQHTET